MKQKSTYDLIYDVVRRIPKGKVATYGQIAAIVGNPRWARVVGYALHVNPKPGEIPCHRVVNSAGRLAPYFHEQEPLLRAEGVGFLPNGNVDMKRFQWDA